MAKKENQKSLWQFQGMPGFLDYLICHREVCDAKASLYLLSVENYPVLILAPMW